MLNDRRRSSDTSPSMALQATTPQQSSKAFAKNVLKRKLKLASSFASNPFIKADKPGTIPQTTKHQDQYQPTEQAENLLELPVSRTSVFRHDIRTTSHVEVKQPIAPTYRQSDLSANPFIIQDRQAQSRFFRRFDDAHRTPPFGKSRSVASLVSESVEVRSTCSNGGGSGASMDESETDIAKMRKFILDQMLAAVSDDIHVLTDMEDEDYVFV